MNELANKDVLLAKYREASTRADDTIFAMEATIRAQREVIDLLNDRVAQLERALEEVGKTL